jgi:hypothetical protein
MPAIQTLYICGTQRIGYGFLFQELLEHRIGAELKSVKSSLVLIEKSAINNLRLENDVRIRDDFRVSQYAYLSLSPGTKEANSESNECL